ncbi:MAG: TlpA disulfide reductase family protein [Betaproteobacteria bacterium]|jgi:thiol-disulfide isomerase/thioredoxin
MKTPNSKRRQGLIVAGVAVAAGVAGAGWQAWQGLRARAAPAGPPWDQRFPTPQGGELDLSSLQGRPLVLNFWATWCPPCIKELPELDRFHREWSPRGWQVVGLAVDGAQPVREFLQKQPLGFAVGMAGLEGTALSRQLGNDQGALPFTAVFDRHGRLIQRKLGQTDFEELSGWARGV